MEAVHGKPVYATSLSDDGELIKYTKAEAIDWDAVDKDISDTNRDYINGKNHRHYYGKYLLVPL